LLGRFLREAWISHEGARITPLGPYSPGHDARPSDEQTAFPSCLSLSPRCLKAVRLAGDSGPGKQRK
jgi:hypothetical protein